MKKLAILIGIILMLSGCGVQANQGNLRLQSLGPAPELDNGVWINSEAPLRLADLRGQVVLIDMWTYG